MTEPMLRGPARVGPDALHEWDRNPRRIDAARLEALKHALVADPEMLEARPLICLPDGRVIGGNMRLRAIKELGWWNVPVFVADLSEARAREWALRDNNTYGEYDPDGLAALVAEHASEGADLALLGFAESEIEGLLALADVPEAGDPDPGLDPDDAPSPPPEPRTRRGEVIGLGAHLLVCGDALSEDEPLAAFGSHESIGAVLTDPPYGINLDTDYSGMESRQLEGARGGVYEPVTGEPLGSRDQSWTAAAALDLRLASSWRT